MVCFSRHEGADVADESVRMPSDILDARVSNLCLSEVIGRFEDFTSKEKDGPGMYPWANRFVMGFPLPDWQRPLVWTEAQKVRFIQSIWSGVDIGSYMINGSCAYVRDEKGTVTRKHSEILLDGQQRLSAIEDYLLNRFSVPDANGIGRHWIELPKIERRRFGSFHFARADVYSWDEDKLRLAYDLRAFGGTAHTEEQRACL